MSFWGFENVTPVTVKASSGLRFGPNCQKMGLKDCYECLCDNSEGSTAFFK